MQERLHGAAVALSRSDDVARSWRAVSTPTRMTANRHLRALIAVVMLAAAQGGTYEISDVRCIPIDDDNAVLVYTGTAYRDGTEPAFRGAMSSVYHRTGDSWRLALYQQTSMAATLST